MEKGETSKINIERHQKEAEKKTPADPVRELYKRVQISGSNDMLFSEGTSSICKRLVVYNEKNVKEKFTLSTSRSPDINKFNLTITDNKSNRLMIFEKDSIDPIFAKEKNEIGEFVDMSPKQKTRFIGEVSKADKTDTKATYEIGARENFKPQLDKNSSN